MTPSDDSESCILDILKFPNGGDTGTRIPDRSCIIDNRLDDTFVCGEKGLFLVPPRGVS